MIFRPAPLEFNFQTRKEVPINIAAFSRVPANTRELDSASGIDPDPVIRQIQFLFGLHSHATWCVCPDTFHHRYIACGVGDFTSHQIPIALLAQEGGNYIVMKVQTHLPHLRAASKLHL
jgi:hypothetical protein